MDDHQFEVLMNQLRQLTQLLVLATYGGIRNLSLKEQVRLLDQAGLPPAAIAKVLDRTPNAIRVMLFSIRKAGSRPKGRSSRSSQRRTKA